MDEEVLECDIKIEDEGVHGDWNNEGYSNSPLNRSIDKIPSKAEIIIKGSPSKLNNTKKKRKRLKTAWSGYLKPQTKLQMYKCPECPFETTWKCYLKSHLKKIHGSPEENPLYRCLQCSFKTKWKFSLATHTKSHFSRETLSTYKCTHCSYESKWSNGLTSHMKVHLYPKTPRPIKYHDCEKCTYKTTSKVVLASHIKLEHGEPQLPRYKCPLCAFETTHKHGVHKHLKFHTNQQKRHRSN